jgi:hypothetical protein
MSLFVWPEFFIRIKKDFKVDSDPKGIKGDKEQVVFDLDKLVDWILDSNANDLGPDPVSKYLYNIIIILDSINITSDDRYPKDIDDIIEIEPQELQNENTDQDNVSWNVIKPLVKTILSSIQSGIDIGSLLDLIFETLKPLRSYYQKHITCNTKKLDKIVNSFGRAIRNQTIDDLVKYIIKCLDHKDAPPFMDYLKTRYPSVDWDSYKQQIEMEFRMVKNISSDK